MMINREQLLEKLENAANARINRAAKMEYGCPQKEMYSKANGIEYAADIVRNWEESPCTGSE